MINPCESISNDIILVVFILRSKLREYLSYLSLEDSILLSMLSNAARILINGIVSLTLNAMMAIPTAKMMIEKITFN